MKMKLLDYAIIATLGAMALPAAAQETPPATTDAGAVDCTGDACTGAAGEVLMRVRTRGESRPVTPPNTPATSPALQPDRKVTVETEAAAPAPGRGSAAGKWTLDLPDGGTIWATEDPTLGQAQLSLNANSIVPFDGGMITEPVRFTGFTNYGAFIERAEVLIYRASDRDLVTPLATVPLRLGNIIEGQWDGQFAAPAESLQTGDELIYIVRAVGKNGSVDETFPQRIQLVRPDEARNSLERLRQSTTRTLGASMTGEAADRLRQLQGTFGQSNLRVQNIPIHGSRVRLTGRNIPDGATLTINGQPIPVDLQRKFAAEYLLPVGKYSFDVNVNQPGHTANIARQMDVDVSGRYFFGVGIADFTLSGGNVSGTTSTLVADPGFTKDSLAEGRLAFYAKAKVAGRYLITAHADTRERELSQLFRGFWKADPQDIFRRLDPDQYYPVYGDDSITYRDVDTMGRLYLRVDWDKNQFLWGNYSTGLTGTEFGQYSRALYGAAVTWRSPRTTALAEPGTLVRVFGSQAQTAPGHSEFIGTGGSLYYLKHTDLLPGSERVVVEVRDPATGRVENRIDLIRGVDYEIDAMQGRIILSRPLAQITRDNVRTLTRDTPLDGFSQVLLADYEFVPRGFNSDEVTVGVRAKHWFGDRVGVGVTYVDENRAGDDYSLGAVDLTLQAGRGTYIKFEQARSQATSAPVYRSDNGGLSFVQGNPLLGSRSGTARSVDARINTRELGWTDSEWSAGAWWRRIDDGFSIARFDTGLAVEERGFEVLGDLTPSLRLYAKASQADRGADSLRQLQLTADWRINEHATLSGELRRIDETRAGGSLSGTLLAMRYMQRFGTSLELYGTGQFTLDDDGGRYPKNNALTLGARYLFGDTLRVGGEITAGNRGNAAQVNGEYRISPDHSIYGSYTYSTDTTRFDPLFNPRVTPGWTLGQRWRLSSRVNLFNESQYLKEPNQSGLAHTFGMDFYPSQGWNLGFTLQTATLDRNVGGAVNRRAVSLSGGHTSQDVQWQSKLEWRRDTGAEQRQQWVSTNWLNYRINASWRIAARLNYADTRDQLQPSAGARFVEGNVGFAWRPWNSTRYALLGRFTYLYDVSALPQNGSNVAYYDQRSSVLSLEGIYHPSHNWEFAGKIARRTGQVRMGRMNGQWMDSTANFFAAQARYGIGNTDWNALAEYRWLNVRRSGTRQGWLVGLDRDITPNLRIGVGYNFTDFSDDLTHFDYDRKGWFLNVSGRY